MAPRKPKIDDDAQSTTSNDVPAILKPKTEKAKVEKVKVEKVKSDKPKVTKPKAPKKEKVEVEGAVSVKEKKVTAKAKGEDGEGKAVGKESKDGKDGKDGKEKIKPVNGDEAVAIIAEYLRVQNRPYSATEVTKTVADKILKEMEQNGQIKGKASKSGTGGQWVFWSIQDPADSASPEELASMEVLITSLRDSLPILKSTLKTHTNKLSTLKSAPTTFALASNIERLRVENQAKGEQLRDLREGNVKMVTTEEVETVERELKFWTAKRWVRKKAFENLEGVLLDGMSREDIWEKAGIEGDCY
ncbi:uncharacterized protein RCO7_08377 [Rhynchosporium graminicola]|uniref:Homologous-pairing protein 2 winged helix domain-containing protein n=1 Tax=Rhynchosporium graminicola TaxID=2792576 RepID=A0A1E1KQB4_9HELO|nr:uncharacterized protein RCO7_08377 [Rhynchosporium commune]